MRTLAAAWDRILLMLARSVVNVINDDTKRQLMQLTITRGEVVDGVERWQNYGYTSVPLPGCDALYGAIGGDRGQGVVIVADDRRYRLKGLAGGEVAIYTDEGDVIHLKRDRRIHVTTMTLQVDAGTEALFNTPIAKFSGHITAAGNITDLVDGGGISMAEIRSIYNDHDHNENDSGGPTDPPNQGM